MRRLTETPPAPATSTAFSMPRLRYTLQTCMPLGHRRQSARLRVALGSSPGLCRQHANRGAPLCSASASNSFTFQSAQQTGPVTSSTASSSLQATSTLNGAGSSSAESASTSTRTAAAAVVAEYPAVPLLPPPPRSGNLTDVVPYLTRLALQERHLAWRLAGALTCIVVTKLAGINLPRIFKMAVDSLSVSAPALAAAAAGGAATVASSAALSGAATIAMQAVLCYGALDCVRALAKEAQTPVFAPLSQAVTRRVAYHTFHHMLCLDTRFHLERRTGRVSRILERGTRSIATLYRALILVFLPTVVELVAVALLLARDFGPGLAAILGATFAAYVGWTVGMTQLATDVRKEVNDVDNQTGNKVVDALTNFETVTLFGNQRLEVGRYDKLLVDFRSAALRVEFLSAGLNAGQAFVLAAGLAAILAAIVRTGAATGGDLVMASGLIAQLWAPLQFLGWFYRELRAALVDMEEFFQILRTPSNIPDGNLPLPATPPPQWQQRNHHMQQQAEANGHDLPPVSSSNGYHHNSNSSRDGGISEGASSNNGAARSSSNNSSSSSSSSSNGVSSITSHGSNGSAGNVVAARDSGGASTSYPVSAAVAPGVGGGGGLSVELHDVSFGYSQERRILRGVSLSVSPGESVAVVGSSGSGKSTILKLLTRLYDVWPSPDGPAADSATASSTAGTSDSQPEPPHDRRHQANGGGNGADISEAEVSSSGRDGYGGQRRSGVYVNGVDVRQLRLQELRGAIAVVPQDTVLNCDSILENIRYGRPDASDAEVEEAARLASLHDLVMKLPEKYDTVVGERGLKLSGGEKQRVAIARAFLRSPRLLICDEATSALDSATESAIMDSLKQLAAGRTALFVAHRLSTIRGCDRIIVLQDGQVEEEGSHEELMERGGKYAAMWELQANQQGSSDSDDGLTDSDTELEDIPGLTALPVESHVTHGVGGTDPARPAGRSPAAAAAATGAAVVAGKVGVLDSLDEASEAAAGGGGFSKRAASAVFAVRPAGPQAAASPAAARVGVAGGLAAP